ncbi:MAG: hypothetical protein A2138_08105 [Deltaproteobacteria bacterium RBG_16_71_12]|nr:MAG: hypothetical protein A2138_08105 [Deltaproteobacteria bacterium RBG_16_71_12]
MSEALQAYLRDLKTSLEAKDPRTAKLAPATLLFSFPGDGQITVEIGTTNVRVVEGDVRDRDDADQRSLMLRTPLSTWLQICGGEVDLANADVDMLGDSSVIG